MYDLLDRLCGKLRSSQMEGMTLGCGILFSMYGAMWRSTMAVVYFCFPQTTLRRRTKYWRIPHGKFQTDAQL